MHLATVTRVHTQPFGAQILEDGKVRFSLWAPDADKVELCLYTAPNAPEKLLPLRRGEGGWFSLETAEAQAGVRYLYRINGGLKVPDPASRYQPEDVHGPSEIIDPTAFTWQDDHWHGRPWEEAVIYELHVGAFTPEGTFQAAREKLDHLVKLGITAIELMPLTDFPGRRNWGYDGALLFAPDASYGRPEDLKDLIQSAHAKGLMVFLDVVYNHFGPEGNYLHTYAETFFNAAHHTPWGAAINFDGPNNRPVRDFYIHNTLYWLSEYHFDGLRFDAIQAIEDSSPTHILREIAEAVQQSSQLAKRHIHLILENDANTVRFLERAGAGDDTSKPRWYTAQWNDDTHHSLHVLLTGEDQGYYEDYAEQASRHSPLEHLGRSLSEGLTYQGEPSPHRNNVRRGEPSAHLPLTSFVTFLQNHDQIGNRAFGNRLITQTEPQALRAALAILLLSPQVPLLFMGEEWGSRQPFPFFCDFGPDLAPLVTEGRRKEFARFPEFSDPANRERIPDPNQPQTYESAILNWNALENPSHKAWLAFYASLLSLRQAKIVPHLYGLRGESSSYRIFGESLLRVDWRLGNGARLALLANLGQNTARLEHPLPPGEILYHSHDHLPKEWVTSQIPAWTVVFFLENESILESNSN